MRSFRFEVGALVLCNMGPSGWRLGRIIALDYREEHWPAERTAPYQVLLEADRTLIYVPEDDARHCREATREDLRIARRMDALAELPEGSDRTDPLPERELGGTSARLGLGCRGGVVAPPATVEGDATLATVAREVGRTSSSSPSITAAPRVTG